MVFRELNSKKEDGMQLNTLLTGIGNDPYNAVGLTLLYSQAK